MATHTNTTSEQDRQIVDATNSDHVDNLLEIINDLDDQASEAISKAESIEVELSGAYSEIEDLRRCLDRARDEIADLESRLADMEENSTQY